MAVDEIRCRAQLRECTTCGDLVVAVDEPERCPNCPSE